MFFYNNLCLYLFHFSEYFGTKFSNCIKKFNLSIKLAKTERQLASFGQLHHTCVFKCFC